MSLDTQDFIVGDWLVRPLLGQASRDGEVVHLEPKVMETLACLARNAGEVLSREALTAAVWPGTFVEDQAVTRAISQLRQSLGWHKNDFLETIPKRGYRLTAAVLIVNGRGSNGAATAAQAPASPSQPELPTSSPWEASNLRLEPTHDAEDKGRPTRAGEDSRRSSAIHAWRPLGVSWTIVVPGGLLLFAAGLAVMWLLRPVPSGASMAGLGLEVQPADEVNGGGHNEAAEAVLTPGGSRTALAWTPDGQSLIFVGRKDRLQQLYVRRLDAADAAPLAGTEGAQVPAVSPDGHWVAFWAGRAIKKIPLASGPVMELMSGVPEPPWGMAWGPAGDVFFGNTDRRIWVIPTTGAPHAVTAAGAEELSHRLPWPLPGGHALLYTVRKRLWTWGDEEVVAQALPTGRPKVVLENAADARYVPSGHLVFLRHGTLFAVPFDLDRLEARGAPVAVLAPVAQALTAAHVFDITGAGQFAVSTQGTLAWVARPTVPDPGGQVVKVSRRGEVAALPGSPRNVGPVRPSRDGRRLALEVGTGSGLGIWVYDVDRGSVHPVIREGEAQWCAWSPDGRLFFGWLHDGRRSVASIPANSDGTARPQVFLSAPYVFPASFTPGGDLIGVRDDREIVSLSAENGHARIVPLNHAGQAAGWPEFSPDGRWLVYGASLADDAAPVTARTEVFVAPYPSPGPAVPVSVEGGRDPAWNPNGRELFYVSLPDRSGRSSMMAVDFTPGTPPRVGRPRRLFGFDRSELDFTCSPLRCYSVALDGQGFYTIQHPKLPPPRMVTHISIDPNWMEKLKATVPR